MNLFFQGMQYLLKGYRDLWHPGIRHYIYLPILVNIATFSVLFYIAFQYSLAKLSFLTFTTLPYGLAWLSGLFHFLQTILISFLFILLFAVFSFIATFCANLFAAPFNGMLSEAFSHLLGIPPPKTPFFTVLKSTIIRELKKFWYYLPRALGVALICLILHFIPPFNLLTPFIFYAFSAMMMAIQYGDYPADNFQMPFQDLLKIMKMHKSLYWGFGLAVALVSSIPLLNFIVMPAAVLGATRLWHKITGEKL